MNVLLIIIIVLLIALLGMIKFTKIGQRFFCPGEITEGEDIEPEDEEEEKKA
jgi:hypothetical protein